MFVGRTEDTGKIQDVIDLIGKSFGESKALLDLMIAFLEEGKVKQAANVMQVTFFFGLLFYIYFI